jgi:hypothetical protein
VKKSALYGQGKREQSQLKLGKNPDTQGKQQQQGLANVMPRVPVGRNLRADGRTPPRPTPTTAVQNRLGHQASLVRSECDPEIYLLIEWHQT